MTSPSEPPPSAPRVQIQLPAALEPVYTNFAILMTQVFTEPFNDPLGYGNYVSGLANKLAGGGAPTRSGP